MKEKPLLILDMDETLIHANVDIVHENYSYKLTFHYVYERPHLKYFLTEVNKSYSLAIWSSATDDYIKEILDKSMPKEIRLLFIWDRSKCSKRFDEKFGSEIFIKNLKKVKEKGFPLEKTLIVDDSPEKVKLNYGNAILIKPYFGNSQDTELLKLSRYLISIASHSNFLTLEKRNWAIQ